MLDIVITKRIRSFLEDCCDSSYPNEQLRQTVQGYLNAKEKRIRPGILLSSACLIKRDGKGDIWVPTIPFDTLRIVWEKMRCSCEINVSSTAPTIASSFAECIRGSAFFFEAKNEPVRVGHRYHAFIESLHLILN